MPTSPNIVWIGSPNFRPIVSVKHGVVFHWIVGFLSSADARFIRPRQTATQYGVGPYAIHQYVKDEFRAPGTGHNGANTNYISIEHEAGYLVNGVRFSGAAATLENSAQLVAHLARKHGWGKMVPGTNAFGHRDFVSTECPGTLPWHWICDRANEINGQQAGSPTNPGGAVTAGTGGAPSYPTGTYNGYDIKTIQNVVGAVSDGVYGPNTKTAVQAFQRAHGLVADGIVGPKTWAAMTGKPTPAPVPPAPTGLVVDGAWGPATTRALQRSLGVPADGVLGPQTYRALQSRIHVAADGVVGPNTRRALQRYLGVLADGVWGIKTIRALQTRLNAGSF